MTINAVAHGTCCVHEPRHFILTSQVRICSLYLFFSAADGVFLLRFNQSETDEENAIVTSTGQFVIAWDFNKVKKGLLDKYEIKKYEDLVVQDNFRFGDDKEIVRFSRLSCDQTCQIKNFLDCGARK